MASIPVLNTLEEEASKRLIDKIKEVYSYARNYGANLKHLREKHESLCAKKNTIEKRVEVGEKKLEIKTEETTLWLQRVEELIADNQTKELVDDSPRPADASCCFGALHRNYYSRYVISQAADIKAKEIKGILDDVPSEPLTLPLGVEKYEPVPTGAFWEGLESRKELLQLILQKLQDNQVHDIALCGMGAIGKTTLAKEVSKRVHGMFDLIVMVEISEVLDIERIQNQIAETIGLPLDDVHTIEHRAKKLYNRLKHMGEKDGEGKKDEIKGSKKGKEIMVEETKNKVEKKRFMVLLIIDNVWGKLDMGKMGIPQERTSNFCTKFLMTSREKKVCMDMGVSSENIIDVSKLNEDEARNLFRARVGMVEDREDFKTAEGMLLRKSGGLPLAVVAIADAVKGRIVSVWQQFAGKLDNLPTSQLADEYRNIYSILETSYQLMENEEKKMFLLIACLFPLGSRIPIEDIMRLCIGLNVFQYVNKLSEAMEMANSWANELMSSSLLLKDDEQGFVKIHDVVRSSFLSFSEKGGQKIMVDVAPRWLCKETWANFTAISLSAVVDFSRLSGLKSDKLQILILKGNLTQQLDDDLFQGMTNLKVLVLTHMNFKAKLPESVAKLEYLQTLHLEHCELGDVQLIGALVNLLVLSFHKSTFMKSPIEIGNLHRLRLLDFRECRVKPTGISTKVIANLPEMEGLYMPKNFTLEMQPSTVDLSYFRYLNVLEAYFTNVIQLAKDDQFVQRLDRFKIYLFEKEGEGEGEGEEEEEEEEEEDGKEEDKKGDIIEKLAVESNSLLYVENIEATQMTEDCLKALVKKANSLLLHSIRRLKHLGRDLDEDGFRSLKYLVARDCDAMNCIMKIDGKDGNTMFSELEILYLKDMRTLKCIWDGVSSSGMTKELCLPSFQKLKSLDINECPELECLGSPSMLAALPQLETLSIISCDKLRYVISKDEEIRQEILKFPKLKHLKLSGDALISFYGGTHELELPALLHLELDGLPSFTQFASSGNSVGLFHNKFKLPSLEKLSLYGLNMMTQLWETPSLEEMSAARLTAPCSSGFQRLKSLTIYRCNELQSLGLLSVAAGLEHLEELTINWCPKIGEVITTEWESELPEQVIKFPKLRQLTVKGLHNLKCFYNGTYKLQFPALLRLILSGLPCITRFDMSGNKTVFFHEQFKLPSLEELSLRGLSMITQLWETPSLEEMSAARGTSPYSYGFQRLKSLNISNCNELQRLGSPSVAGGLEQLEELTVERCPNIEEVITAETGECELPEQVIKFPKLRQLTLKGLDILKCFYNGTYKLQFPALQRLILTHLPCITRFAMSGNRTVFFHEQIELSSLNHLELEAICHETEEDIKDLWCIPSAGGEGTVKSAIVNQIPCLRTLVLDNVKLSIPPTTFHSLFDLRLKRWVQDKILFSTSRPSSKETLILYSQLPKLADLFIEESTSLEVLFENQGAEIEDEDDVVSAFCAQLKRLTFVLLPKLKPLPDHLYKNLCLINISQLSWKYLFSADIVARDIAQALPLLESVEIRECQDLESVIENELRAGHDVKAPETIEFPRLKHIYLYDLPKARHFNCRSNVTLLLPSLEDLDIVDTGLVSFSPGIVLAPKLTEINLRGCKQMETFFSGDNAIQLPSLRDLSIGYELPRMQRFSSGPLQAPLLNHVVVDGRWHRMKQTDHINHPINDYVYSLYKYKQEKRDKIGAQELIPSSSTVHASSEGEEKSSQASL